jgi:hypothetical protein
MQFQACELGSHNMKKTKSFNCMWIDRWLDHHQNRKKCEIVGKDDVYTPNDKIMFIKSQYVVHTIFTMSICRYQM